MEKKVCSKRIKIERKEMRERESKSASNLSRSIVRDDKRASRIARTTLKDEKIKKWNDGSRTVLQTSRFRRVPRVYHRGSETVRDTCIPITIKIPVLLRSFLDQFVRKRNVYSEISSYYCVFRMFQREFEFDFCYYKK